MTETRTITFRDERLVVLIGVVVLAVTLSGLIALPSQEFVLDLFGSELSLRFSGPVQVVILLILLICAGVDTLVRHPSHLMVSAVAPSDAGRRPARPLPFPYRAAYYSLPTMLTVIGVIAVHSVQWWGYQIAAATLLGLALASVIGMQLSTHTLESRSRRTMRLLLNAVSYALAIGLFGLIFGARLRSVISAPGIMLASGLLSVELYRNSETSAWRIWLYSALTALLTGELIWALNYTALSTPAGAALLLLAFYTITGLVQQHLWGRLTPRVVVEYMIVLGLGLLGVIALL